MANDKNYSFTKIKVLVPTWCRCSPSDFIDSKYVKLFIQIATSMQ